VWQGSTASAPSGVTLPDSAGRNSFRNSLAHRLATVVARSVSAFLPGRVSVGRTMRGITSITFVRAAESVRRPGLARSSGEVRSEPCHTLS